MGTHALETRGMFRSQTRPDSKQRLGVFQTTLDFLSRTFDFQDTTLDFRTTDT